MDLSYWKRVSDENFIPSFVVIGNLLPIVSRIRRGTSFFYDHEIQEYLLDLIRYKNQKTIGSNSVRLEMNLSNSYLELLKLEAELESMSIKTDELEIRRKMKVAYDRMQELPVTELYRTVASENNFKTFLFPYLDIFLSERKNLEISPRFYFLDKEPDVDHMIELNIRDATSFSSDFIFYDGIDLLDFSRCCVETFADLPNMHKKNSKKLLSGNLIHLFEKFTKQVRFSDSTIVVDPTLEEPEEPIFSFYSEEFFPHSIFYRGHCQPSIDRGKAVYKALSSIIPKKIVNDYFYLNLFFILNLPFSGYSQISTVEKWRRPLSAFLKTDSSQLVED